MSKINVTVGEKLFSSFFNENGRNSKYEFGQWKYLKNWAFYAFILFFKFLQFPWYVTFYANFGGLFWTPKIEGELDEFDIFECAILTASSKPKFWWILVLATLEKMTGICYLWLQLGNLNSFKPFSQKMQPRSFSVSLWNVCLFSFTSNSTLIYYPSSFK